MHEEAAAVSRQKKSYQFIIYFSQNNYDNPKGKLTQAKEQTSKENNTRFVNLISHDQHEKLLKSQNSK